MTAQLLTSELTALIQDSRRKNIDLRNAAEKSLADLKALPNTSEAQLAADLKRRSGFVKPFLLACHTRNPKFAGSAIVCLQRLVVSNGLPQETLKEVLEALRECCSLGLEIQLKVLQALPTLLQNYASSLIGELLGAALQVCFLLYNSKIAVVSNTAAAALQQLVVSVLEKVAAEDDHAIVSDTVAEVPVDHGTIRIRIAALDGYRLLNDLCLLTEGNKPEFLSAVVLSQDFGLELIESMIANHADTVASHPEQIGILRTHLMPLLTRIISERVAFSTTLRAMRLLQVIFRSILNVLATECETAFNLLNRMLDPDAAVLWKRTLCMEMFRTIHSEPPLIRKIYAHFDGQDGKKNIIRDHMATLVRLAAEQPTLIGLGHQSSVPSLSQTGDDFDEQVALQADGVAGAVGLTVSIKTSDAPGISMQWSNMRVPCMEQLDKSEAPFIPATYIYSLALTCINSFSEGLARFLLPFTIPSDPRLRRRQRSAKEENEKDRPEQDNGDEMLANAVRKDIPRSQSSQGFKSPINPLELHNHALYNQISTSAYMVDTCWPALLAACSTFFNAALDSESYHALVRSCQKFTQVAGLLRLSTPRDAFLTTLGKNAVPPGLISTHSIAPSVNLSVDRKELQRRASGFQGSESNQSTAPGATSETPRQPTDLGGAKLNTRNLLCLRALLNLGIALGPVLQKAWSIIFETLQQADLVIAQSTFQGRQQGGHIITKSDASVDTGDAGEFEAEIAAVETAAARMLESTSELPEDAFLDILISLKSLLRDVQEAASPVIKSSQEATMSPSQNHRRGYNAFGGITNTALDFRGNAFVMENLSKIVELNLARLLETNSSQSGWTMTVELLLHFISLQEFGMDLRLKAVGTIKDLVQATSSPALPAQRRDEVRQRALVTLRTVINCLYSNNHLENKATQSVDIEIHRLSLDALRSALEEYGDSLLTGWDCVFMIIGSVFVEEQVIDGESVASQGTPDATSNVRVRAPRLVRSAFGSLQLICSDFLSAVPQTCTTSLLHTIHSFCAQQQDFNISLTSTTLFWNVSDYLWGESEGLELPSSAGKTEGDPFFAHQGNEEQTQESKAISWLNLLFALVEMTTDARLEIRHSALHTLFRVLNASGDKFRSSDWMMCHRTVVLKMLSLNDAEYQVTKASLPPDTNLDNGSLSWNETAIIMLDGVSHLLEQSVHAILPHPEFASLWQELMGRLQVCLDRRSLAVSRAVFAALARILAEVAEAKWRMNTSIELAWDIWRHGNPVAHNGTSPRGRSDNQPALLAYLQCLKEIYPLISDTIELATVKVILEQLRICASGLGIDAYYGDTDTKTPLQSELLNSISMILTNSAGVPSALVDTISFFTSMAYERDVNIAKRKGPTYIAMSKSAMDLLRIYVLDHVHDGDLRSSGALSRAIHSLTMSSSLKYQWHSVGKEPLIWKKATTTAVAILKAFVPAMQESHTREKQDMTFWTEVIRLTDGIVTADCDSCPTMCDIDTDQDFDIVAFFEIRNLITTSLGSNLISDQTRRMYAEILFRNSIIHEPHPSDMPKPGQDLLEGLRSTHIGRTQTVPPSPRSRMSYLLLDELFDLVAVHDGVLEQVKMAQAAAPFLILRVGIVLKAYILDQPLRGRMPQPSSQKREMIYILRKLVELDSEPKSIPNAPGINSEHKKHLHRLYALITRAMRVARRNQEIQQALILLIDAVEQDFGI